MAKADEKEADAEAKGGGKKKLIIIALPVVVLALAAAWFLVLKPKDSSGAAAALPTPKPGTVVTLDPITVNLAAGHFLKVGLALQPTAGAPTGELDGSKALDLLISEFSGKTMADLSSDDGRAAAKAELLARIELAYLPEGKVTDEENEKANLAVSNNKAKTFDELTAGQAEKRAKGLTVQSDIYEIYFTEFVMQ